MVIQPESAPRLFLKVVGAEHKVEVLMVLLIVLTHHHLVLGFFL